MRTIFDAANTPNIERIFENAKVIICFSACYSCCQAKLMLSYFNTIVILSAASNQHTTRTFTSASLNRKSKIAWEPVMISTIKIHHLVFIGKYTICKWRKRSGAQTKSDFNGKWAHWNLKQLISMLLAGEDLFKMKSPPTTVRYRCHIESLRSVAHTQTQTQIKNEWNLRWLTLAPNNLWYATIFIQNRFAMIRSDSIRFDTFKYKC